MADATCFQQTDVCFLCFIVVFGGMQFCFGPESHRPVSCHICFSGISSRSTCSYTSDCARGCSAHPRRLGKLRLSPNKSPVGIQLNQIILCIFQEYFKICFLFIYLHGSTCIIYRNVTNQPSKHASGSASAGPPKGETILHCFFAPWYRGQGGGAAEAKGVSNCEVGRSRWYLLLIVMVGL